jgi:ribosomal protein S18 acetylase RimI-like enzyme
VDPDRDCDELLAAAVEADLVEHVARLHEPPMGEVRREGGSVWFLTGKDDPNENGVLRAPLGDGGIEESVRRLTEPFAGRGLPMMWWVFTRGPLAARLDQALRARGLALRSDRPGMGLDLGQFDPPTAPKGTTVERVRDPASLRTWAGVVGRAFADPAFAESPSVAFNLAMGFGDDGPFRHFVCRVDGACVGAATLSLCAPGVAGLANVSTVPEWRGRGIGGTVASTALLEARAMGIAIVALSSDDLGVGLYRKLGFRTVCRHLTYVGRPVQSGNRAGTPETNPREEDGR